MMTNGAPIERSLRICGILLILALIVEATSLIWQAPLAFLLFVFLGGALFVAGILLYLYSLVQSS
jgi:hypothetical protein